MAADSQYADRETDLAIAECLAEFQRRRAAGDDISESEWIARHPLLAAALRSEFEDRRKLVEMVAGVGTQNSPTSPEIPVDLDYIGSYRLKERLGQGGMGVVFRATQQGLGRDVAVKVLPQLPHVTSTMVERFRREATLASRLCHPHIVSIIDVGCDKGHHFFSMELMVGGSLENYLAGEVVEQRVIARWIMHAARAVAEAHRRGVVHRDIKPANLLLDEGRCVKVADFGLARDELSDCPRTTVGNVLGTVAYMSPEQAGGTHTAVGPASDVYSLGATLYALLSGAPPIRRSSLAATLAAIVAEEPLPLRRHLPHLHRDLETICLKCLEKAPLRRYESADALTRTGQYVRRNPITGGELSSESIESILGQLQRRAESSAARKWAARSRATWDEIGVATRASWLGESELAETRLLGQREAKQLAQATGVAATKSTFRRVARIAGSMGAAVAAGLEARQLYGDFAAYRRGDIRRATARAVPHSVCPT